MAKKFFDIIPPKGKKEAFFSDNYFHNNSQKKEEEYRIEKDRKENNFRDEENKDNRKLRTSRFLPIVKILISVFIILAVTIVFLFFHFSQAKIEIWPKMKNIDLDTEIVVNLTKESNFDFKNKIIPGKILEDEEEGIKNFSSSGKMMKGSRAKGIIRVFNNYSTSPQPLLPQTRFVSSQGKLFRSLRPIVIPGGHYEKGKFVPGFIDIEVMAAEPGESYNIGPSTFSIPGFRGTAKYTYFYGKSFQKMTGGFKGEVSQVTADDIKRAEGSLADELKEKSKKALEKEISSDYILIPQTVFQSIIDSQSSVKPGGEGESFSLRLKTKAVGIAVKRQDIDKFITQFISENLSKGESFRKKSIKIEYSSNLSFLEKNGAINDILKSKSVTIMAHISLESYYDLDSVSLRKAVTGKYRRELELYFKNYPQVEKIKIISWPFLRKKAPDDLNKIKIEIRVD